MKPILLTCSLLSLAGVLLAPAPASAGVTLLIVAGGGGGGGSFVFETGAVVPEQSTWAMVLLGFAGLAMAGHRTSRKAVSIAA